MKYIYNSPIPEAAQTGERDRLGQQLATAGVLQEDGAVVEAVSSEAADLRLEGQYRWGEEISTMLAEELDELSDSSLPTLPLYRRDGGYSNAGYYEIESADVEPLHANERSVWSFDLSLTYVGDRASHFRVVRTDPGEMTHDFGNDLDRLVGLPAAARKVRWMDPESTTTELAQSIETRPAMTGDVEIYDLDDGESAVGNSAPALVYEIDYEDDVRSGVRAYDTQGHTGKFASSGVRHWQTIHSTEHDLDDAVALSNGILRVVLDDRAPSITVDRYDADTGRFQSASLGGENGWELFDTNLLEIGMADAEAQLTFAHDSEGLFALNAALQRGRESLLLSIPDNESGPIPSGLETWLSPIAATTVIDPGPTKGLVSRSKTQR